MSRPAVLPRRRSLPGRSAERARNGRPSEPERQHRAAPGRGGFAADPVDRDDFAPVPGDERPEALLDEWIRIKEKEAFRIAADKIASRELDMHLVDVEYTFDSRKIIFYFTADGRVDFRELLEQHQV